jgi:hypothetical protein
LLGINPEEARSYLPPFTAALRESISDFTRLEPFFIIFILHIYSSIDNCEFLQESLLQIGELIVLKPVNDPLFSVQSFLDLLSLRLRLDLASFVRTLYLTILGLPSLSVCSEEKLTGICRQIFYYLFSLPRYDPFHYHPLHPRPFPLTRRNFQEALPVFFDDVSLCISCNYATRTSNEGKWHDSEVGLALLRVTQTIPHRPSNGGFSATDMVGLLASSLIQHEGSSEAIAVQLRQILSRAYEHSALDPDQKRFVYLVIGGIIRDIFAGNTDGILLSSLFVNLVAYGNLLIAEPKQRLEIPTDLTELANAFASFGKQQYPILESICRKAAAAELLFAKQFEETRMIDPIRLTKVEFKSSRSSTIEQLDLSLEQFIIEQRSISLKAVKKYRTLFQSLSVDNGPWSTPEYVSQVHFKMDNSVFKRFVRLRTKLNLEFDDHREASLFRDVGRMEDATEIYQNELRKMKLHEFQGDFALLQFTEEDVRDEISSSDQHCRLTCNAQLITPSQVFSGTLSLFPTELFFSAPDRVLRIPLSIISKLYFRRYVLVDSAIEIFHNFMQSLFH